MLVAGDESLADIEARGVDDLASLTRVERRRFDELMVSWIWAMQKFYQQDQASMVVPQFQEAIGPFFRRRMSGAGFLAWWTESRQEFVDTEFRDSVDKMVDRLATIIAPSGGK